MPNAEPGWYPHPDKPGWLRYWEGLFWTNEERRETEADKQAKIVCPYCQQAGSVTVGFEKRVKRKTATRIAGAVVTGGGSLGVFGVSKKGTVKVLSCSNCSMRWDAPQTTF